MKHLITFSILSVDHSMGTQNFYLNNLNKVNQKTHYINFVQHIVNNINTAK